jgi:hypothetical protein
VPERISSLFFLPVPPGGREYLENKSSRGIPSEALVLGGAWFETGGGGHREGLLCSSAIVGHKVEKDDQHRPGMISRAEICKNTHTISSVLGESASTDYSGELVERWGRRALLRNDAGGNVSPLRLFGVVVMVRVDL